MDKEKQIKDIAQCICEWNRGTLCTLDDKDCNLQCTYGRLASKLTAKDYRKFSEVAEEIFAGIHNMLLKILKATDEGFYEAFCKDDERAQIANVSARNAILCAIHSLAELKKKYTEKGKEQDG